MGSLRSSRAHHYQNYSGFSAHPCQPSAGAAAGHRPP